MAENFVVEAWSELAIALCFIILRLYARVSRLGWGKLALDDALMVLAALTYTTETAAAYFVGAKWLGLANSDMTAEQRATIDPHSEEWRLRVNGSKTHVVGWYTYTTLMWLLKGCWIVYYSRLTEGVHKLHPRIQLGYILVGGTYLAAIMIVTLKCIPFHKQWQIFPDPGNNCQPGYSRLQVSSIMALNTATDLYLMAIPLPMIYQSRLRPKKKITLFIMFSGGFLAMTFGILRCVSLLTAGATNPAESGEWSVRESFVAVLISNLPMIFPVVQSWWHKARGYSVNDSSAERSYPLGSRARQSKSSRKGFLHPLSIPNDTAFGSDEAIVVTEPHREGQQTGSNDVRDNIDPLGRTKVQVQVHSEPQRKARSGIFGCRQGADDPSPGHITVVQEYSIQEELGGGKM